MIVCLLGFTPAIVQTALACEGVYPACPRNRRTLQSGYPSTVYRVLPVGFPSPWARCVGCTTTGGTAGVRGAGVRSTTVGLTPNTPSHVPPTTVIPTSVALTPLIVITVLLPYRRDGEDGRQNVWSTHPPDPRAPVPVLYGPGGWPASGQVCTRRIFIYYFLQSTLQCKVCLGLYPSHPSTNGKDSYWRGVGVPLSGYNLFLQNHSINAPISHNPAAKSVINRLHTVHIWAKSSCHTPRPHKC